MIIVSADSADEAADLHDLLGRHLAWRHRIYVGGAEYRPEDACYHPDPEINAEVAADVLDAELADLAAGYPPRRWLCPCGAEHSRGHFLAVGMHRCLACGYTGTGGVLLDGEGG